MAKVLNYESQIGQGEVIQSWHVSQSVDAFTGVEDYDITLSGSFTLSGSAKIEVAELSTSTKPFVLSYDASTGQVFKMNTSSIDDGDGANEVYTTSSNDNNIVPAKFGSNKAGGNFAVVTGGSSNSASADQSFIGAGTLNTASGGCSVIVGGVNNSSSGDFTFIGSGNKNKVNASGGVIGGGDQNQVTGTCGGVVSGLCNLASGAWSFVGAGFKNSSSNAISAIVAGHSNNIDGQTSFIGAGNKNYISGHAASVVGGTENTSSACRSFIGGGCFNVTNSTGSVIAGGKLNCIANKSDFATIAGGCANNIVGTNSCCSFIGGGSLNCISGNSSGIGAGLQNSASAFASFIGSGCKNQLAASYSFLGSGRSNCNYGDQNGLVGGNVNELTLNTQCSFLGGGQFNYMNTAKSVIVGGECNRINRPTMVTSTHSGIVSGFCNNLTASRAVIGAGCKNQISETGTSSGILAGDENTITHACSFVVGANITSHASCTTHVNNLTVSGSNGGGAGASIVIMRGLPTSDPTNVGQVWNDSGTLKISAG